MGEHQAAPTGSSAVPVPPDAIEPEVDSGLFACLELLPSGRFMTKPRFIGATDEEVRLIAMSEIGEGRGKELYVAIKLACNCLIQAVPMGTC